MSLFFDEFYKLFIGTDTTIIHLLEIVFRTSFMYVYAILNVRLMNKRSMGLLSPFEIIIIIALGASVGDPMFYRNIPLIHGMFVISTIVLIERIITKISMKSGYFEKLLNGTPVLIIKDGHLEEFAMKKQNITKDELYSILRLRGVKHMSEIELAYLETSGSLSIIRKNSVDCEIIPNCLHRP